MPIVIELRASSAIAMAAVIRVLSRGFFLMTNLIEIEQIGQKSFAFLFLVVAAAVVRVLAV